MKLGARPCCSSLTDCSASLLHHAQDLRRRQREPGGDVDLAGRADRRRGERRGLARDRRQPVRHHQPGGGVREIGQRADVARRRLAGRRRILTGAGARAARTELHAGGAGLLVPASGEDGDRGEHRRQRQGDLVRVLDLEARVERDRHGVERRARAEQALAQQRRAAQRNRHDVGAVVRGQLLPRRRADQRGAHEHDRRRFDAGAIAAPKFCSGTHAVPVTTPIPTTTTTD